MMAKKFIALICIVSISLFLSACGSRDGDSSSEITAKAADTSKMNFEFTDRDLDASYNEEKAAKISFESSSVTINGSGASKDGTTVTLSESGTYIFSGVSNDGMIKVNASDSDKIQIVLNGLELTKKDNAALYIKNADKVFLTLAHSSQNTLSDGSDYTSTDGDTSIDATIFSKADLTINGSGSLTVNGNAKHAVVSKDDLVITGGKIDIHSKKAGLCGKDCIKLAKETEITVNSGTDGLRSDNSESDEKGYIYIEGSKISVTSGNDALQAQTVLKIKDGSFVLNCGGGSKNASTDSNGKMNEGWGFGKSSSNSSTKESAKGLKADSDIIIEAGTFEIDSADDSIHSNSCISISGGTFSLASGDDGIHADSALQISNGSIDISKSYEGLEANEIGISGGSIKLKASDDGLNAAGGNDSSSVNGRPGENSFSGSNSKIIISGGYLYVNASGDGIDSNGSVYVSGGTTIVSGPTSDGDSSLDYDGEATITGGVFIALGSSGMAQGFSSAENQGAILYTFNTQASGSVFALCNTSGKAIVGLTSEKEYSAAVISAPEIDNKSSYSIVIGATIASSDENGFAHSSDYSGGESIATIEMNGYIYSTAGTGMGGHQMPNNNRGGGGARPDSDGSKMPTIPEGGDRNPMSDKGFKNK